MRRITQDDRLIGEVLAAWRVHDRINLRLLRSIPAKSLKAVPLASRGRNVAQVFAHMHKVRTAWLRYNAPELVAGIPRLQKGASPTGSQLKAALGASGKAVATLLTRRLEGGRGIKAFKQQPVRWMAYLISHESHHRGQIALALKQCGVRLPADVAIKGLWQDWYWGR